MSGPRPFNVVRDKVICAEYLSGRSLQDVGDEHGITRERVRQILAAAGIEERHFAVHSERRVAHRARVLSAKERSNQRAGVRNVRRSRVREMYNSGFTYTDIAVQIGVAVGTVESDILATGGPDRNAGAGKTNRRLTVADRQEIVRMYNAGASLKAIGTRFDVCAEHARNIAYAHGARRPIERRAAQSAPPTAES